MLVNNAALRLALRRPSPRQIPLTGDAVYRRNYHSASLWEGQSKRRFYIESAAAEGFTGLWFSDYGEEGMPASVNAEGVASYQIAVRSYIRELELEYKSAFEFILHSITRYPWLLLVIERLRRKNFNRTKLVRADRIKVLNRMVEETIDDRDLGVSPVGLVTKLYGDRWIGHPDNERLLQYYTLVLDSLVTSEDLIKQDYAYRLLPKAVATLSNYQEENRRHNDNVAQQRAIVRLTFVLVIVGLIQAVVSYWGSK